MTFNQGNPYTRPARQMYVPLDTEDRILVERHYIPATVYRDLYNIPRYVPVAINNNHNHNHTHNPYNIFEPNRNTFFSNLPYPTPSTIPTTTHTPKINSDKPKVIVIEIEDKDLEKRVISNFAGFVDML